MNSQVGLALRCATASATTWTAVEETGRWTCHVWRVPPHVSRPSSVLPKSKQLLRQILHLGAGTAGSWIGVAAGTVEEHTMRENGAQATG